MPHACSAGRPGRRVASTTTARAPTARPASGRRASSSPCCRRRASAWTWAGSRRRGPVARRRTIAPTIRVPRGSIRVASSLRWEAGRRVSVCLTSGCDPQGGLGRADGTRPQIKVCGNEHGIQHCGCSEVSDELVCGWPSRT
jgi:hypothetical protein